MSEEWFRRRRRQLDMMSSAFMSFSNCIMLYGHDDRLLETRSMVLERAGFQVLMSGRFEDVERAAKSQAIELLILCYSVTKEERERLLSHVEARRPNVKLLLITSDRCDVPDGPWATVDALAGAKELINAARKCMTSASA